MVSYFIPTTSKWDSQWLHICFTTYSMPLCVYYVYLIHIFHHWSINVSRHFFVWIAFLLRWVMWIMGSLSTMSWTFKRQVYIVQFHKAYHVSSEIYMFGLLGLWSYKTITSWLKKFACITWSTFNIWVVFRMLSFILLLIDQCFTFLTILHSSVDVTIA